MTNIVIAGSCGVGKSTVAETFARSMGILHLDFDELRAVEIQDNKVVASSPCSVSKLNLRECLPSKLDKLSSCFILDFGGDTVFRNFVDNEERLKQVFWLKENYSVKVILLVANREILLERFITSEKNRDLTDFDKLWVDWQNVGEIYWRECADLVVDTTNLSVYDAVKEMKNVA